VGEALAYGRALHKADRAFSQWIKAEGFDDIDRRVRADAMWLAQNWSQVSGDQTPLATPGEIRRVFNEALADLPPAPELTIEPHLQRIHPCAVEEVHNSIQKERRIIDTLEPVMNQHRLVMDAKVILEDFENYNEYSGETEARYQLFYQLTRITREKGALAKDDRLDALAIAVGYWVDVMDKDTLRIIEEHREVALQMELGKFMEHITGENPAWDNMADEFMDGLELEGL
jgi:hypothetical protein